ncbi:MAG TPA: hypothetical protein VHN59_06870 [Chitinophagaceae bacterium]|nr:hypothetical protein [Chitinophagaceae bacterium]
MINAVLKGSCNDLLRKINLTHKILNARKYPEELLPCFEWVNHSLEVWEREIKRIQRYLHLNLDDKILEQTWYDELTSINNEIEVLDVYYVHPLFRASEHDILALKIIQRLHSLHKQTEEIPFLLSNGSFSIAASENGPTLYWLPVASQMSLLHFPLFFHEFGHLLFLLHKDEMEALIGEFQNKLSQYLRPIVTQSDEKYKSYLDKASDIVETWREWMEELFCDAIGLVIGGQSYLYAFSNFIRLGGTKEYFVPESYLSKRSHPVSLLRIRFLAERAQLIGFDDSANKLMQEWESVAAALDLPEDYFGYFDDYFKGDIVTVIDDMLVEANPVSFNTLPDTNLFDYFKLIDDAWKMYNTNPGNYPEWETNSIESALRVN